MNTVPMPRTKPPNNNQKPVNDWCYSLQQFKEVYLFRFIYNLNYVQVLEVVLDPFGKRCQEMYEDKTMERKLHPTMLAIKPPPIVEDVRPPKVDPTLSKRLEDTKITEKVRGNYNYYYYKEL